MHNELPDEIWVDESLEAGHPKLCQYKYHHNRVVEQLQAENKVLSECLEEAENTGNSNTSNITKG